MSHGVLLGRQTLEWQPSLFVGSLSGRSSDQHVHKSFAVLSFGPLSPGDTMNRRALRSPFIAPSWILQTARLDRLRRVLGMTSRPLSAAQFFAAFFAAAWIFALLLDLFF